MNFGLRVGGLVMAGTIGTAATFGAGSAGAQGGAAELKALAVEYYAWRLEQDPVGASDMGAHAADARLADFSEAAIVSRRQQLAQFRARFDAFDAAAFTTTGDRADRALFGAQLDRAEFHDRVRDPEHRDPGMYVDHCSNAVFSLLKKPYAPNTVKIQSAIARLDAMPALLAEGRRNLVRPVKLYTELAIDSVAGIDSLFQISLMALIEGAKPDQIATLIASRDKALRELHAFGDWLKAEKLANADPVFAMGRDNYRFLLHRVDLLPLEPEEIAMLGEVELARAKALEGWAPFPPFDAAPVSGIKGRPLPASEEEFLSGYERQQSALVAFLASQRIVTVPKDIGEFKIRELPAAFKPTAPGGFMNPPGVYDKDSSGFYFIPTLDPASQNFFLRAAISDPRPILGHEGIPGHHFQISLANRHANPIRRMHDDGVFIEGWAFYTEEMLLRAGLYADTPETVQQVNRLMRLRAARIAVDVRLATGAWTFEQAVEYLVSEGGMDREAAKGEAAGAAAWPGQKICYTLGKWQIQRLLGLYRDARGPAFTLTGFHDELLSHGSLPVSVLEWLMLNREDTWKAVVAKR